MNEQNNINDDNNEDNNINNSNNNLPNINNNNNNDIDIDEQNNNFLKKYKKMTISFIIIFFINIFIEIYSFCFDISSQKYVFQFLPIYEKKQYYRFISSYFIHYGIWHIIIELYITYKVCYLLENIMGTLITISFIMTSMIMNSFLHFIIIFFIISIYNLTHSTIDMNYDYESGFTSVLFTMATFYYNFKDNCSKKVDILYTFSLTSKYISLTAFCSLCCFTPNNSYLSNLSGLLNGHIFKRFPFIFLPRIKWVIDFEKKYKLKKYEYLYRSLNIKNILMKNALNELEKNSMIDDNIFKNNINENYGLNNNNGLQMTELSNNQNNIGSDDDIGNSDN